MAGFLPDFNVMIALGCTFDGGHSKAAAPRAVHVFTGSFFSNYL